MKGLFSSACMLLGTLLLQDSSVFATPTNGGSQGHGSHASRPKRFDLDLTWETRAPDGVARSVILTNGQLSGPLIRVNQFDDVEIHVTNCLPFRTSVHFHGIEQLDTPWSDGVPGVTQRPIEPGEKFTYRWNANQYGAYWYHAHLAGQIMDGMYGPIYVDPAPEIERPFHAISNDTATLQALAAAEKDPKTLVLSDWFHITSADLRDVYVTANIQALCMDSILVNGKGSVNCQSPEFLASQVTPPMALLLEGAPLTGKGCVPLSSTIVQTNTSHNLDLVPATLLDICTPATGKTEIITVDPKKKWASLTLTSAASASEFTFSIDNHPMWVYAIDGLYVVPQKVDAVFISHGNRYAVFVELNQPSAAYTIRVAASNQIQLLSGIAKLSYGVNAQGALPEPSITYAGTNTSANVVFHDDVAAVPFTPDRPALTADTLHVFELARIQNAWTWVLNGASPMGQPLELIEPLLFNNTAPPPHLTVSNKNSTWVDLVLVSRPGGPAHPIHKHGNKGYIIGAGEGEWTWNSTAEAAAAIPGAFDLVNPRRRDGFYTLPSLAGPTWMVVRYQVTNPGAWLLHCHINPHLAGGMAMVLLDGVDKWPTVPKEYLLNGLN